MTFIFDNLKSFLKDNSLNVKTSLPGNQVIKGLASLKNANNSQITFFSNSKNSKLITSTKALACFIKDNDTNFLSSDCIPIIVDDPYKAFAISTNFFTPKEIFIPFKDKTASIDSSANISNKIIIKRNSIISEFVSIGSYTVINENVFIGKNVIIGKNVKIFPNVVITNSIIGNDCTIQSGSIIGDPGFGFTLEDKIEINHIGNVVIGNNVVIGSLTTVDRATLDSTIIGDNSRLDNLIQIAHNVTIGKNAIIASQAGIAGSTSIGINCTIGGQAGIGGHLIIGDNVTIAGKSGVTKNLPNDSIVAGFPAINIKQWKKSIIKLNRNA